MSLDNIVFIQSHHPIISNPSSVLVSFEVLETNEVMIVAPCQDVSTVSIEMDAFQYQGDLESMPLNVSEPQTTDI